MPKILIATGEINCGAYTAAVINSLLAGPRKGGWNYILVGGGAAFPGYIAASTVHNIKQVWIDEHYDYMPSRIGIRPPWLNTELFFDTINKDIHTDLLSASATQIMMYYQQTSSHFPIRKLVTNQSSDIKNAIVSNYCLPGYTFHDYMDSVALPFKELSEVVGDYRNMEIDVITLQYTKLSPYMQAIHSIRQADLWQGIQGATKTQKFIASTNWDPMNMSSDARTELLLLGKHIVDIYEKNKFCP